MAASGGSEADAPAHPLLDIFLLARLSMPARLAIAIVAATAMVAWGIIALRLHLHYARLQANGESLGPLPHLFADGATVLTAWPGWAAAMLFAVSAWRLGHTGPEPPAGRGDAGAMTISELRAGLRREYTASRIALVAVTGLALLDLGRLLASLVAAGADGLARIGLGWMAVEVLGLAVATLVLSLWAMEFRIQLLQLGAL